MEICIEFTLLPNSYEKSWKEIDAALIKQGLLIGLTMLVILWVIFKIMIGRISVKENLLLERTEVLKKTNEELSRAYKTTSLGAMTGHLMHGLRGQLTNLIQNAIDARNGVSISLSCRKSDSFLEIDIADNGSGIPASVKNRLFEPVVSKKGGSGIGLALSQQLAESIGAKLILIHSDQTGTSFRLSIPYHS